MCIKTSLYFFVSSPHRHPMADQITWVCSQDKARDLLCYGHILDRQYDTGFHIVSFAVIAASVDKHLAARRFGLMEV